MENFWPWRIKKSEMIFPKNLNQSDDYLLDIFFWKKVFNLKFSRCFGEFGGPVWHNSTIDFKSFARKFAILTGCYLQAMRELFVKF